MPLRDPPVPKISGVWDRQTDRQEHTDLPLKKCISSGNQPKKGGEYLRIHCSLPLLPNPYGSAGTVGCLHPPPGAVALPASQTTTQTWLGRNLCFPTPSSQLWGDSKPLMLHPRPSPAGLSPSPGGISPEGDSSTQGLIIRPSNLVPLYFCPCERPRCLSRGFPGGT